MYICNIIIRSIKLLAVNKDGYGYHLELYAVTRWFKVAKSCFKGRDFDNQGDGDDVVVTDNITDGTIEAPQVINQIEREGGL